MPLKPPESLDECLYFTNRPIGNGHILAWVYRKECPQCHQAKMGKPLKKGKIKTRADYYACPNCGYQEKKQEHEASLQLEARYTCPECGKDGESTASYQRKNYKGLPCYLVECQHCRAKLPLTKKLK